MSLEQTLMTDMKAAMKAGDKLALSTVRGLLAEVKNVRIDKRAELDESDELALLARQAKRRRESIEAFRAGGRTDLVEKEEAELRLIEGYLPKPLTAAEVEDVVRGAVEALGASGKKDFGRVMQAVMPQVKGRFPGKDVRPIVERLLGT